MESITRFEPQSGILSVIGILHQVEPRLIILALLALVSGPVVAFSP
jgi:hypothetical protein